MSDATQVSRSLRDRLGGSAEDRLGRALSDLLESPLLTGAVGRAADAREKAVQAQEVAMGALNLPSAADMERLTRRLRSLSQRLEGIEDGVDRIDRSLTPASVESRLDAIESELARLADAVAYIGSADRDASKGTRAPRAKRPAAKAPRAAGHGS